ncbi:MAG: hypothetical protein HC836_47155 [Richelia sp. RM2_1_2]|nr:hypothetical protein [Richelia sp. SM1_7_0]NJN12935.1 hypothetical protein [Richelia sp. RM1_1_1]NJO31625.1 hypothetical protein [Richelia sp. SL_2_1]NJO65412.1 hypothetical protein [Richelia sp. RM2_1_2]
MSSFSEQNIKAFIELLNNQPSLFSCQELEELEKEVASLKDDIEELSKFISAWYLQRPTIRDAQYTILKPDDSQEKLIPIDPARLIPNDSQEKLSPNNGGFTKPQNNSDINKKLLENSIKKASDSISNNPKEQD